MNVRRIIHEIYRQEKNKPLDWAQGGCLSFPGKVAKAITGEDPTHGIRKKFSSEAEAKKLLVKHRCRSLGDMAAKAYPEIPVAMARAGDWAVVRNEDGTEGLGVVVGSQIAVSALAGIGRVSLASAASAYRVR